MRPILWPCLLLLLPTVALGQMQTSEKAQELTAQQWVAKALELWDGNKFSDPKQAIAYLSEALRVDAKDAVVYYKRGNVYYGLVLVVLVHII